MYRRLGKWKYGSNILSVILISSPMGRNSFTAVLIDPKYMIENPLYESIYTYSCC